VQEALAVSVHLIKIPMTAKVFPIVIVMGMMILKAALVVGIVNAAIILALSVAFPVSSRSLLRARIPG